MDRPAIPDDLYRRPADEPPATPEDDLFRPSGPKADPEATAVRPVPPPLLPAPAWQYRPGTPEADLLPSERPYVPLPPPASRPAHGNLAGSRGVIILLVLLVIAAMRIKQSRIGRAFQSIRESEIAAETMGIHTHHLKILAFALSAFYSGVAGSLYAHVTMYISPDIFNFLESARILVMLLIGGSGSIIGALLGGFILTFLPEALRFMSSWYMAAYGAGIILLIVYMPTGITGLITRLARRYGKDNLVIPI